MINGYQISVIIPAYNEEAFIGQTISYLDFSWLDEIIVINDGSKDNTAAIARQYPVSLLNRSINHGKGEAVNYGLQSCKGDIIAIIDADLKETAGEVKKLIMPIAQGEVEATIAVLPINGGGLGLVRKLAEWGLKMTTGVNMKAPLSGQRAFRRRVLDQLLPLQAGFGLEMGLNIALIKQQVKYREIACNFKHRISGKDLAGYIHRLEQFIDILKTLWQLKKDNYV